MRKSARILFVAIVALGGVALTAVPGGAGALPLNTVIVEKHVTGDVPAGTTFTVQVTCASTLGPAAAAPTPVTLTFDAKGDAVGNDRVTTSAGTQCAVEETVNGGATSTTYSCSIVRGPTDEVGPPFLGNCGPGDNQATFGDVIGDTATIGITNVFPTTPTTPTTTPQPPAVQPAAAVQAPPAFTG